MSFFICDALDFSMELGDISFMLNIIMPLMENYILGTHIIL